MLQEVTLLSKSRKLQTLINRLIDRGFTVYITADHGNTECTGIGSLKRTGVETETKSKRMIVLKDFG
jgi:bisphosphoglycerate-independent phosphoglycerate mutase (AlkP superfamily)